MTVQTPIETRSSGLPRWAILLTLVLFLIGGVYLAGNLVGENPPLAVPGQSAAPGGGGSPDPAVGEQLVAQAAPQCASCHGPRPGPAQPQPARRGERPGQREPPGLRRGVSGQLGPALDRRRAGDRGIDRMGMPAFGEQFSPEQLDSIVAYLESLP